MIFQQWFHKSLFIASGLEDVQLTCSLIKNIGRNINLLRKWIKVLKRIFRSLHTDKLFQLPNVILVGLQNMISFIAINIFSIWIQLILVLEDFILHGFLKCRTDLLSFLASFLRYLGFVCFGISQFKLTVAIEIRRLAHNALFSVADSSIWSIHSI